MRIFGIRNKAGKVPLVWCEAEMILFGWLFIGLVALVSFRYAITSAEDELAILTGLVSAVFWLMFGFQSLNVEVVTSGIVTTYQFPTLMYISIGMAIPNAYIVLTGPLDIAEREYKQRGGGSGVSR